MLQLYENIKKLRKENGWSQEELARKVGYTDRSSIARIEKGQFDLPQSKILQFAEVFNIAPGELMGRTAPPPIKIAETVQIRILGSVAAGYDKPAEEADDYETVGIPEEWLHGRSSRNFFILQIHGDSMYPHYQDGDYVFCLSTSDMGRSGRIGVVIDKETGEATLKRINYPMSGEPDYGQWMELEPINPNYPKRRISGLDLNNWMVQGRALKVIRTVEEI